jgi:hypothetical protein
VPEPGDTRAAARTVVAMLEAESTNSSLARWFIKKGKHDGGKARCSLAVVRNEIADKVHPRTVL